MADTGNTPKIEMSPEIRRYIEGNPSFWETDERQSIFMDAPIDGHYFRLAGHRKAWAYFQRVIRTNSYLDLLDRMREKHHINPNDPSTFSSEKIVALRKDVRAVVVKEYGFTPAYVEMVVNDVFRDPDPAVYDAPDFGVCAVADRTDSTSIDPEAQEHDIKTYPVVLKISPHASKRDLLEFITKVYRYSILPLQKKHQTTKNPVAGVRARMPMPLKRSAADLRQERDDFIYRHRDWPLKKISKELSEVFALYKSKVFDIDQGGIGKILSIERKRREV